MFARPTYAHRVGGPWSLFACYLANPSPPARKNKRHVQLSITASPDPSPTHPTVGIATVPALLCPGPHGRCYPRQPLDLPIGATRPCRLLASVARRSANAKQPTRGSGRRQLKPAIVSHRASQPQVAHAISGTSIAGVETRNRQAKRLVAVLCPGVVSLAHR